MIKVTLTDITPDAEQRIAEYAAICYDADTSPDANERRVKKLMNLRHLAVLRFASATFKVEGISRVCSHQMVRHPHLSFLQRSQRYANDAEMEVVIPEAIAANAEMAAVWKTHMDTANLIYKEAIASGIRKEDARFILPQSTTTEMYVSGNLQAWFDFLVRRMDKHAQWEIRAVAELIFDQLKHHCPNVFSLENLGVA